MLILALVANSTWSCKNETKIVKITHSEMCVWPLAGNCIITSNDKSSDKSKDQIYKANNNLVQIFSKQSLIRSAPDPVNQFIFRS